MKDKTINKPSTVVWKEIDKDYFVGTKDDVKVGTVSKAIRNIGWYWVIADMSIGASAYVNTKESAFALCEQAWESAQLC